MALTEQPARATTIVIDPINAPLAQVMNDLRAWMDGNRIEPADFKTVISEHGIGIEIRFLCQDHADMFERVFRRTKPDQAN